MAKATTKRKTPAKRGKPAGRSVSGLALSGWIVAAGFGAAWAGPQFGLWSGDALDRVPSLQQIKKMVSLDGGGDAARPAETHRVAAAAPTKIEARTATPAPAPAPTSTTTPSKKPVLPPIKADTISEIVRKAEAKPSLGVPKPQGRMPSSEIAASILPPIPVPEPIITAAIRRESAPRAPSARPGEMAIRRYPFTTAPAVAYVGDLRTIRILGGEGDWKKVEVSASGVTGWIRLQRLGAVRDEAPSQRRDITKSTSPIPAASLMREADAAVAR